tara:strand:+ start:315 stop:974 length:660 start_codon:yes stop_codon:yes gene_type:complete
MKTALIFGSSGLVGGELLQKLIESNYYKTIKIFVRKETEINNPIIESIKTDFNNLQSHNGDIKGDDCFFCIGTTKKNTPDKKEYKRVERDIPVEIASIAKKNNINTFIYISSGFANPKSSGAYLKYKGEVEEELKKLNFETLGILRPSFLVGDRKENRVGEKIGIAFFKIISPLFIGNLKKMKSIKADNVAEAMLIIAQKQFRQFVYESDQIVDLLKFR